MAHTKYYDAVEKAQKGYDHHKSYFKKGACGYFTSEGASREKLADILQGIVRVANGEPAENLFSDRHQSRVRIFARQYEVVQKFEWALEQAKNNLGSALENDERDFHEV